MLVAKLLRSLAVLGLMLISLVAYIHLTSAYFRFKHKSTEYHAAFAQACNSILAHHPLGGKKDIELSLTDPSLPGIITDLHPVKIGVAPNKVWVLVNGSHTNGLAVIWEPEDDQPTNAWALSVHNEDDAETVYVTTREPPNSSPKAPAVTN